ncbi:MAG: hypothetical protein ACNFW9_05470 [Candidatus Kerfeldbacteria bacterium]|jgi:hypothetical protein
MKAKVVITEADAIQAIEQEKYDLAILMRGITPDYNDLHLIVLPANGQLAGQLLCNEKITIYSGLLFQKKSALMIKSDYVACSITWLNKLTLFHEIFPEIEMTDRDKYRFDGLDLGKPIQIVYPYVSWTSFHGKIHCFRIVFSNSQSKSFDNREDAKLIIATALKQGEINRSGSALLLNWLKNRKDIIATKAEVEEIEQGYLKKHNQRQIKAFAKELVDTIKTKIPDIKIVRIEKQKDLDNS